jgi:hypothetical protein
MPGRRKSIANITRVLKEAGEAGRGGRACASPGPPRPHIRPPLGRAPRGGAGARRPPSSRPAAEGSADGTAHTSVSSRAESARPTDRKASQGPRHRQGADGLAPGGAASGSGGGGAGALPGVREAQVSEDPLDDERVVHRGDQFLARPPHRGPGSPHTVRDEVLTKLRVRPRPSRTRSLGPPGSLHPAGAR